MSLIFTINDILIENSDVLKFPKTSETINLGAANTQLLPSELELILDNTVGTYDDRATTSIFFGTDWYNSPLTIYDTVNKVYIWKGKVKSIDLTAYNKTVKVKSANLIQDISETLLEYSSTTNTTPAEHIYNILVDVVGISTDDIYLAGFTEAINIQDAASVYTNIVYTAEDSKQALPVISELCRMTQCELYTEDNRLKLKQYQVYNGELGTLVEDKNLISSKSYAHFYDRKKIVNTYTIKYDNSGTIASENDSDTTSQASFGSRSFNIPNESIDSTTSSEYKILFKSQAAAAWAGDLAITRFQSLIKFFIITTGAELDSVNLNEQVDLSFDGMSREPGRLIEKDFDTESQQIVLKGYYLNTPYQYFVRDTTPPETPEISDVFSLPDGSVAIKFTQNFETDFVGYRLYFTSTAGEWEGDQSSQGDSPIDIKNPDSTGDGYNFYIVTGLNNGTSYSFKMKSYDTSFNMSDFSNTETVTPYVNTENKYMLTGNYVASLTLDQTNPGAGTSLSGLPVYDTAVYGTDVYSYAATYQTEFFNREGLSSISFRGFSQQGSLDYQYDQSDDGSTWDGWSTAADATGFKTQALSKAYARIRFLFAPLTWLDSDYIYITEVD